MVDYTELEELSKTVGWPMGSVVLEASMRLRRGDTTAAANLMQTVENNYRLNGLSAPAEVVSVNRELRQQVLQERGAIAWPTDFNGVPRNW